MNVVITGASRGIGKAIAEGFAAGGHDLFLCSRNIDSEINWQQQMMKKYNCSVMSSNADLGKEEEVRQLAEKVLAGFGQVDVLVNNAGFFEPGSVHNEAEGVLQKTLDVNLFSAYHLTRALLPGMMNRRSGHIFNICSVASLGAYHNGGAYSISKWALLGFTRNLREEMKLFGIKVTAVIPGATWTASWEASGLPPERFMEVNDIARMVVTAAGLSAQACVEDIVMRPQYGDI